MRPTIIECANCGEFCGREYPDTHDDPGFREGPGEDFVDSEGNWYCSVECLRRVECDECGHPAHEPGKCEIEREDGYRGAEYMEALGPCTCGMKP